MPGGTDRSCPPEGTAFAGDEGTRVVELWVLPTADADGTTADELVKPELEACAIVWLFEFLSAFRFSTSSVVLLWSSNSAACSCSVDTRASMSASNALALRRLSMSSSLPTWRFVDASDYQSAIHNKNCRTLNCTPFHKSDIFLIWLQFTGEVIKFITF